MKRLTFAMLALAIAAGALAEETAPTLSPAAMKLMGDWNWWMPRWLDRALPRIALDTEEDQEPAASRTELQPA